MTKLVAQPSTTQVSAKAFIDVFETQAKQDGMLNDDGFFVQDDWEFELNSLPNRSVDALQEHLAKGPVDHETAVFLKGYLMNSRDIKFTPFEE